MEQTETRHTRIDHCGGHYGDCHGWRIRHHVNRLRVNQMLYIETVSRVFTGGILEGVAIMQSIKVTDPRPIMTRQEVKPIGGSPYVDIVVSVEPA